MIAQCVEAWAENQRILGSSPSADKTWKVSW